MFVKEKKSHKPQFLVDVAGACDSLLKNCKNIELFIKYLG